MKTVISSIVLPSHQLRSSPPTRRPLGIVAALLFALAASSLAAHAGTLTPDLKSRAAALAPGERVRVIVRLASQVDLKTFNRGRATAPGMITALRAKAQATQPAVLKLLNEHGVKSDVRALWIENSLAFEADSALLGALAARADIATIDIDRLIHLPEVERGNHIPSAESVERGAGATDAATSWADGHLTRIRVPELWAAGLSGQGVVIGSIDSGFDPSHPALAGKWRGGSNSWRDFVSGAATPLDEDGHGTHTIGTMVGGDGPGAFPDDIGVAYGATFIAARIFGTGSGYWSWMLGAAQWMLDPDGNPATNDFPDIINNSWYIILSDLVSEYYASTAAWRAAGIIPVFCIGNYGPASGTTKSPGDYNNVIGVGATTSGDELAHFSSHGPAPAGSSFPADGRKPDLSAPGDSIVSCVPGGGYEAMSGTSMAAPHVAGVIALMKSGNPSLTYDVALSSLISSAYDLGPAGFDHGYGYGLVDAYAAACVAGSLPPGVVEPPMGLAAASGEGGINLSWTASRTPGILRYDVYRSSVPHDAGGSLVGATTASSFADTIAFGAYWYKVRAVGSSGTSESSNEVHAALCMPAVAAEYEVGGSGLWPAPYGMVAGDFNGDGIFDLAVANADNGSPAPGSVSVLLGQGAGGVGDGTFAPAVSYTLGAGQAPWRLATGDFNGDGILDLVMGGFSAPSIAIMFGTGQAGIGDGAFGPPVYYACGSEPERFAVGDFNADGVLDLAIPCYGDAVVSVLMGNGVGGVPDGTFAPAVNYACGAYPVSVTAADYNSDGVTDLAVTQRGTSGSGSVLVLLGVGVGGVPSGTFAPAGSYPAGSGLGRGGAALGDFNADGVADLAVPTAAGISILLGNGAAGHGDGTFRTALQSPGASGMTIAVGDWSGDGVPDLLVRGARWGWRNRLRLGLTTAGLANGDFGPELTIPDLYDWPSSTWFAIGDYNSDGTADLALGLYWQGSVAVLLASCQTSLSTTLEVLDPPAGSTWVTGQQQTIHWTKGAGILAVDVAVSRDGGAHWQTIASNCVGTSLIWAVAGPYSDRARIRVFDPAVPSHNALSPGEFTILPASLVGVNDQPPLVFALRANGPNPFNPATRVAFEVPVVGRVSLVVFDVNGRRVRTLVDEQKQPGRYSVTWDGTSDAGRRLASGLYFCRMESGAFRGIQRMTMLR
jgi:subtilisin family serine protease